MTKLADNWKVLPVAYNIDTMTSTPENYIYQNIKMEYMLSNKLENLIWQLRKEEQIVGLNDLDFLAWIRLYVLEER